MLACARPDIDLRKPADHTEANVLSGFTPVTKE